MYISEDRKSAVRPLGENTNAYDITYELKCGHARNLGIILAESPKIKRIRTSEWSWCSECNKPMQVESIDMETVFDQ